MNPLVRAVLGSIAAALGAALAVKLFDEVCDGLDALDAFDAGASRARRRVELQERAEVLEAELEGVHLVREAPAQTMLDGGVSVPGIFGAVPVAEA